MSEGGQVPPMNGTGSHRADRQAQTEQARAQIRGWAETGRDRAQKAQQIGQKVENQVVEVRSPRGEVRVQVDGHGLIQDVEFGASAPGVGPLALARAVQRAHDAALRQLQEQTLALAQEELADYPELAESLRSTYQEAIPDRVHEDDDE